MDCNHHNQPRMISFEVKSLSNLIMRELMHRAPQDAEEPLTGAQGWVIGYLYDRRDRDVFQRDLEAEFHIRRSTVSGILQLLEKRGLIIREPVEHDARLKKLRLTDKAIERHSQLEAELNSLELLLRQGLSEAECEQFFRLIGHMRQTLQENSPPEHDDCDGSGEHCRHPRHPRHHPPHHPHHLPGGHQRHRHDPDAE